MSDVNANIRIGVDSTQAISSLRSLQNQISAFNKGIVASNAQALAAQSSALSGLTAQIGATKQFSTSIVNVESSVSRLGKAIDKNKLSLGEYFRYGAASTKNFGRVFGREHTQIMDLASERVKRLQTQYIALSSAQNGMTKAMAVRPLNLFNADAAISVQRQQIFNKLLRDGSTSLINFGKNTQWAGRQLMVGFTVPLTIFGGIAGQIFMDLERQVVNFRRVYGDAMTPSGETDQMIEEIKGVAKEFTKYGIAVKDTVGLASDIAATGAQGEDLVAATAQSTRLATLGMIEMNQAMDATISLQTAFKLSNEELANSVNFLNAVENQTVLSLDDVTVAIPKVAPIIKGLGGDVQDLAFFLTAMREGGVNAAEGANALKSGLASLINPTKGAREQLEKVGINIDSIIKTNKGDIRATVQEFGNALMTLDKFSRQQTLAKVFGKYQFARLGALFENINRDGSQAQRVLDLTGQSVEELASLADKELGAIEESIGMKFTGAVERLKLALAPIGEVFLRIATPIIDFATKILEKFNELSPGVKQFISVIVAGVGVVVPTVIMLIGLFGNFIGQAIKGFAVFNSLFNRLRGGGKDLQHLSEEQLDAAAAASSLEGKTESLTSALNVQRNAVNQLARAYGGYVKAAGAAASGLPQGFRGAPRRMASGGMVPGSGNQDTVPALLTPGETVITKEATQKYAPILQAMNDGSLPGFKRGVVNLGGEQIELDFAIAEGDNSSILAIERMFDRISEDASQARQEFVSILRNMQDAERISAKQVQDVLRESSIPELQTLAAERRYNASGAGESRSISRQIQEDMGVSAEIADREYRRAQRVAESAANELGNWYDQQINMLDENDERRTSLQRERDQSVRAAAQVDRAHIVELTNQQKTERAAWDARLWMPQSGVENQLSNMLKNSESNRNVYSQYLMSLGDDVASEQQKATILRKINSNLALTENELQIQKVVLDGILADSESLARTSAKFAPYARATSAAATVRSQTPSEISENLYRQSYETGRMATVAVADGAQTASNSRATIQTGEFIAGGLEEGIKRGTPSAINAAENLRNKVDRAINSPRRGASRPQGPAGVPTSTLISQMAEERIAQGQAQRGSRGRVVRPGTMSPLALRSGEESTRIANINNAHALALEENTKRINDSSKELDGQQSKIKKFGSSLVRGNAKITGAMFAMDGVVFAASMMNNSMGEFAQKIMPAVFAVQGLAMTMPILISILSNPIGLAAAAIAAVGVGFWVLDNKRKDLQREIIQTSVSMNGSSKAFDDLSKELGSMKPSEKFASLFAGMPGTKKEEKALTEGQQFLETESGQSMLSRAKLLSGKNRKNAIENELLQSLALEIITPEQARGVARALALSLKDPILGASVVASIYSYVRNNKGQIVKPIQDLVSSVQQDIRTSLAPYDEYIKKEKEYQALLEKDRKRKSLGKNNKRVTQEEYDAAKMTQEEIDRLQQLQDEILGKAPEMITMTIGPVIDSTKKLAEAQAYLNIQYRKGNIDRKEYLKLTNDIQTSQSLLADAMQKMQLSTTDVNFGENLKMAALSIGITEQEFENMATQARALESVLVNTFGKDATWAKEAANTLQFAMTSGALSAAEAGSITNLLSDKKYSIVLDLALQGEDPATLASTVKLLNQIDTLPEPISQEILTKYNSQDFSSPEAFNTWAEEVLTTASYFTNNPKLQLEAYVSLNNGESTTKEMNNIELFINKINNNPKISSEINFEMVNLKDLSKANKQWDSLGKKKNISKIIKMEDGFSDTAKSFGATLSQLDSLPNVFKQAILLEMNIVADLKLDMKNFQTTIDDPNASARAKMAARRGLAGTGEIVQNQINQLKELFNLGTESSTTGTGGGGAGDGGSATKSWLQQLIDDTQASLALFPGMLNQLKGVGIPEQIIEMIGGGEEGLKRAKELLGISREKLNKLIADFNKNTINEIIKSTKQATQKAQQKNMAIDILISQGMSREDANAIASDSENVLAIITAAGDKSGKSINKLVKAFRELQSVPEFVDPIKNKLEEINNIYKAQMLPLQQKIDKQQEIVNGIQEEIDELQKLSGYDQDRIRDLERQKEMIQRQIEEYERANELDQRRIDTLQRQNELRNRESDALSHELDVLSDMEQKIRDAYQERIDALTTVANLNDDILERQKDQLGVSQALAEGDIYAATAAAQQMRQNQIRSAQQLSIDALNQARDNSVAGLVTSGGLTRDQAEEKIRQIKEQSYQTSLLVRDIEDEIFNRNQLMIPLKDQQLNIDRQIRDISDIIYDRESKIINIQREKLDPQTQILKNITDQASELKKNLDIQSGLLDGADLLNSMTDEQITAAGILGSQWHEVAKQIKAAQTLASNKKADLEIPDPKKFEGKPKKYAAALEKYNTDVARVDAEAQTSINAIIATGQAAMNKNMGGKIMKYARGNVVGSGGMDSVPAMLTPGEYVIRKAMVDKYGTPMFDKINQGSFSMPSFNTGEKLTTSISGTSGPSTNVVAPMYNNYSVNVSVSNSGASADEIANKTLMKIKQLQNTQIRSGRGY